MWQIDLVIRIKRVKEKRGDSERKRVGQTGRQVGRRTDTQIYIRIDMQAGTQAHSYTNR